MDLLTVGQIGGGTKMLPSHWHVAVNKSLSPGPFYFVPVIVTWNAALSPTGFLQSNSNTNYPELAQTPHL